MDGSRVLERVAACLPCASWPCGARSWQLWPGDFDEDAEPILTAPTPALAECLIPPSVSNLYADRDQSLDGAAVPWDTGAASPSSQAGQRLPSPRGPFRAGDGSDRHSVPRGGIELKEAAANPLLGQAHLENGGRFVKAKLPAAEGTAVHASSASRADAFSFPSQDVKDVKAHATGDDSGQGSTMSAGAEVADPSPFGSPAVVL